MVHKHEVSGWLYNCSHGWLLRVLITEASSTRWAPMSSICNGSKQRQTTLIPFSSPSFSHIANTNLVQTTNCESFTFTCFCCGFNQVLNMCRFRQNATSDVSRLGRVFFKAVRQHNKKSELLDDSQHTIASVLRRPGKYIYILVSHIKWDLSSYHGFVWVELLLKQGCQT